MSKLAIILSLLTLMASVRAGHASPSETAAVCDRAGAHAAQVTGVPLPVLQAIALTETGRRLEGAHRPWPWTVNMEGKGTWFDTQAEALAYAKSHHARGARSYDVGCFQINYRWHGQAFASVEDMFDPVKNAVYAGQFLRSLYEETGSWSKSAAAYHSRTPEFANRYRARFDRILARINGGPLDALPTAPVAGLAAPMLTVPGATATDATPAPLNIAGPLALSPPDKSVRGSVAGVGGAGSFSLLQRAGRRLY